MVIEDTDILQPELVRQGGLVQRNKQRVFRKPPAPLEPPTPRVSVLGLDQLPIAKRAASSQGDGNGKCQRLDSREPRFKVPSLPASRMSHMCRRTEDTPSHPGGLSEEGRVLLEAHRRRRDHKQEGISTHEKKVDRPRGLDDFKRRSNRDRDRVRGRQEYPRGWEVTPRSERGPSRDDPPSLRVPNLRWDATPRTQSDGSGSGWDRTGDIREWEEEQVRLDRDWYTGAEEGSLMGDEEHNPLAQYEDLTVIKQVEVAKWPVVNMIYKKLSAKQAQYNADNDLWEANRMVTSDVATRKGVDLDFEDESLSAVHVMVHDLKPPFLDGRTVFTKQLDPINPIRDLTSGIAAFAKKGSALVKEKREQAERAKAAAKLAALGGTALGNILGLKDEEAEEALSQKRLWESRARRAQMVSAGNNQNQQAMMVGETHTARGNPETGQG
ncbi:hypothetical protein F5888DRAFT_1848304 [Russula emetica]|nr:hypothetical protein F5888DRAFT_1848304 [Russula emetica]